MNQYVIITTDSVTIKIDAETWEISDDHKRVFFSVGRKNTAVFVLENIVGFAKVSEK